MKKRFKTFAALAALLPVLALVGCNNSNGGNGGQGTGTSPSPSTSPTPDFIGKLTKRAEKAYEDRADPSPEPSPNRPLVGSKKLLVVNPLPQAAGSSSEQSLVQWQYEIAQASATVSDAKIALRYSVLVVALDTKNDQETAQLIKQITATPLELEVMLYRISPEMRSALWSRLPIGRTNAILDHLTIQDQGVMAWYFGELHKIGLAPEESVPWNRIP